MIRRAREKKRASALLVLSGPNLNLLGKREPKVYGKETLADIHASLQKLATDLGATAECRQSNHEGVLIDWLHETQADAIILNAGGLTHTSIALRDAIASIQTPVIEVHMSHVFAREPFRRVSVIAEVCNGMVSGFGGDSYRLGVRAAMTLLAH